MSNFSGKRPTFRRVMRAISDAFDDIMTVYLIISLIMILIPLCLLYILLCIYLPDNLVTPITTISGGIITVVVVPLTIYHIKRNHANKDKYYEQNKELYIEVSKILVNILVDKSTDLQAESYKQLNLFLDKHYSEMCIFFPENLIWKLFVILRECECEKHQHGIDFQLYNVIFLCHMYLLLYYIITMSTFQPIESVSQDKRMKM